MQIEWSEGEVLKLAGVDTEAEEEVGEQERRLTLRPNKPKPRERLLS
jgi:hypothetical protein